MSEYGAHSVRRAATSAIRVGGAPSDDVMNSVSWRSEKPVARHYDKSNIEIMKNDMCICLINGIFLERGMIKKSFENKETIFMVRMYRAKSPNSQFGGTDHLDMCQMISLPLCNGGDGATYEGQ